MTVADPTQIPESHDAVQEYLQELEAAGSSDQARAEQLALAVGESTAASEDERGRAFFSLAQMRERDGRTDDAIDAYRRAQNHGHPRGEAEAARLRGTEQVGHVEAARAPENEAEARRYFDLGQAAITSQDWERAAEIFEAIYRSPVLDAEQQAGTAYFLGEAYRNQGSHDAAYQMYQEAHETGNPTFHGWAQTRLAEYNQADGTTGSGTGVATSQTLSSAEDVDRMLQAGVDRYDNNDAPGAEAHFTAAHSASVASAAQRGYAAYYLGVISWYASNFDVARTYFREARDAGGVTAENAQQMLQQHWGE